MSKRCFIFGALEITNMPLSPSKGDMVIAADKGILNTEKFGITPTMVIGDFDSLGYTPSVEGVITLPTHKDDTDTGYAINEALKAGCDEFYIYGALGGRSDMSFASIQLLASLSRKGVNAVFFGNGQNVTAVTNGSLRFENGKGRISVFAHGSEANGVFLDGLEYPLKNASLSPFFPLGVSNSFAEAESTVSVNDGTLIVFYEGSTLPEFKRFRA